MNETLPDTPHADLLDTSTLVSDGQRDMQPQPNLLVLAISLARSVERRRALSRTMDELAVPFRFLDAVDAADGFARCEERTLTAELDPSISDGEFACALSHRKAVRQFRSSDHTHLIVLEDDAVPTDRFAELVKNRFYERFDMLLLYHSRALAYRRREKRLSTQISAYPLAVNCSGAVAYCVNREAAARLDAGLTPIKTVADWPIDLWRANAYAVSPRVVAHADRAIVESTIPGARAIERRRPDPMRFFKKSHLLKRARMIGADRIS